MRPTPATLGTGRIRLANGLLFWKLGRASYGFHQSMVFFTAPPHLRVRSDQLAISVKTIACVFITSVLFESIGSGLVQMWSDSQRRVNLALSTAWPKALLPDASSRLVPDCRISLWYWDSGEGQRSRWLLDGTVSWYAMLSSDKMQVAGLIASISCTHKYQVPH